MVPLSRSGAAPPTDDKRYSTCKAPDLQCTPPPHALKILVESLFLHSGWVNSKQSSLFRAHLVRHVVEPVQLRVNHAHQLLQRLRLELAHGKDALVQPRAGACSQSFLLKKDTKQIKAGPFKTL